MIEKMKPPSDFKTFKAHILEALYTYTMPKDCLYSDLWIDLLVTASQMSSRLRRRERIPHHSVPVSDFRSQLPLRVSSGISPEFLSQKWKTTLPLHG